jgi:hypothetical protein
MNTKIALGWLIIAPFFAGCSTTAQQVGSIAISKDLQFEFSRGFKPTVGVKRFYRRVSDD